MIDSKTFPAAHKSVEIVYENQRGRFGVAVDDIDLGTTIIKEDPITYALHPVSFIESRKIVSGTNCLVSFSNRNDLALIVSIALNLFEVLFLVQDAQMCAFVPSNAGLKLKTHTTKLNVVS